MDKTESFNTDTNDKGTFVDKELIKKRAIIYLSFVYGFVFIGWLLTIILPEPFNKTALSIFSFFPFLSTLLTRVITRDKSPWFMKLNIRKDWKIYLMAAFLPSILIFFGSVLYFLIFPNHLDLSAYKFIETYGKFGVPLNLPHTVESIIKIGLVGVAISPFIIPVGIFALGEEIGWRGYFLPALLRLMNEQKAVLLSGVLWGLCHAPLIYFGFNYGLNYWGAPYTGILMMTLVGTVLSVWLSYVTIKTNSVMPATILHGAINVIGEFPALVATLSINTLLGPNPTGIIGLSALIIGAVILLRKLPKPINV